MKFSFLLLSWFNTSNIYNLLTKGWIFRLFREARSDLSASFDIEESFISANLIIQSMKKLQKVIFFCLGDVDSIQELFLFGIRSSNPFWELLDEIQKIINYWMQKVLSLENIEVANILLDAKKIFNFTKIFVMNFIDEENSSQIDTFPEKKLRFKSYAGEN